MRADVLELVFAGAVLVVFGSAAATVLGRFSRRALLALGVLVSAAALAGWVVFALEPSRDLGVAAGGLTVCAVFELGLLVLRRRRNGEWPKSAGPRSRNESATKAAR